MHFAYYQSLRYRIINEIERKRSQLCYGGQLLRLTFAFDILAFGFPIQFIHLNSNISRLRWRYCGLVA